MLPLSLVTWRDGVTPFDLLEGRGGYTHPYNANALLCQSMESFGSCLPF